MILNFSRSCEFQVKKTYAILLQQYMMAHPQHNGNPTISSDIWSILRMVKLTIKINTFIWKLIQDGIPVNLAFTDRGIPASSACPMCKEDTKSTSHHFSFLSCG